MFNIENMHDIGELFALKSPRRIEQKIWNVVVSYQYKTAVLLVTHFRVGVLHFFGLLVEKPKQTLDVLSIHLYLHKTDILQLKCDDGNTLISKNHSNLA